MLRWMVVNLKGVERGGMDLDRGLTFGAELILLLSFVLVLLPLGLVLFLS